MNLDNNWINQSINQIKGGPGQPVKGAPTPAPINSGGATPAQNSGEQAQPAVQSDQIQLKGGRLVGQAQAFMSIGPNVSGLCKEILNAQGSQRDDLLLNFRNHLENMFPEQLENEANAALEYLAKRAAQPGNDDEEPTLALLAKTIGSVLREKQREQPSPFPPSPVPPRPFPHVEPGPGPNIRFD